jgi:colanic acid/amylovoran biosynthesis glycosyltransferase
VKIAYLVNRYPAASHSFIRREIEALEAQGAQVSRYSVRQADIESLPDPRDRDEMSRTCALLSVGSLTLVAGLIATIITRPIRGLQALRLAMRNASLSPKEWVRRIAYLAEAAALAKMMAEAKIEHLHAHFGTNPAMVARLAWTLGGIPYSFTVHGPDEFDAPVALDLRAKVNDAAFCIAISDYGKSQLMRWTAYTNWHKIQVVRCGVDQAFIDCPTPYAVPTRPVLCAVARLSAQKGIPLLVEAAARLREHGRIFELVLVGDGEMRADIEQLIEQYRLSDCVSITGWASTDEVVERLQSARAMVLPSFAEGLPVVIMEALALGRPVIVSAIAGTPELVDSSCGWLINAGSVDALTDAMAAALDTDAEVLRTMGRAGRERVIERHDSRTNGMQLLQLIKQYHGRQD